VGGRRGGRWSWRARAPVPAAHQRGRPMVGHNLRAGLLCQCPLGDSRRAEHSETLAGSRAMACPLHATPVTLPGSASGWHVRVNEQALKNRSSNLRPLARGLWVRPGQASEAHWHFQIMVAA
jgi:hypothetical protein